MAGAETLNKKERQLIYLSASIASGCLPCSNFHIRKSSETGLTDIEINNAMAFAISIRNSATYSMESIICNHKNGDKMKVDTLEIVSRNDALIGISAAYSVNFPSGLEKYLSIAESYGIIDKELCEIISISKSVVDMARAHVDIVIDRIGIRQPGGRKIQCCSSCEC